MEDIKKDFSELEKLVHVDQSKMKQWRQLGSEMGRDLTAQIKMTYHSSSYPIIDEIKEALQRSDLISLKKQFHKMKSGCGNVGFVRLQKMCEYSEALLTEKMNTLSEQNIKYICHAVEQEFNETINLLESL